MIGESPERKEERALLTGVARYIDDIVHPGMLPLTPGRRYALLRAAGAYR